jgi:hypothetical protein
MQGLHMSLSAGLLAGESVLEGLARLPVNMYRPEPTAICTVLPSSCEAVTLIYCISTCRRG